MSLKLPKSVQKELEILGFFGSFGETLALNLQSLDYVGSLQTGKLAVGFVIDEGWLSVLAVHLQR